MALRWQKQLEWRVHYLLKQLIQNTPHVFFFIFALAKIRTVTLLRNKWNYGCSL